LERWNKIGDKLLVGKTDHTIRLATSIARNYIDGFPQPGRTVQEDFVQQLPAAVDLGHVGAVFNRIDKTSTSASGEETLKWQDDARIAQLFVGLSASVGYPSRPR
jgi:hypothetical protein